MTVPTWDEYFLTLARIISSRSKDVETQHGAIVVSPDNRILATGYNSFPPGMSDQLLPNYRPDKYRKIIHAEMSAITHWNDKQKDCILYCTGKSCKNCLYHIYSAGIKHVICANNHGTFAETEEDREDIEILINQTGLSVETIDTSQMRLFTLISESYKNYRSKEMELHGLFSNKYAIIK